MADSHLPSLDVFRWLSSSAALLISVAAALLLGWRGRAKWEPSEEDIPGALNQLARLLTAVTMVLILSRIAQSASAGAIVRLNLFALIGCLCCFFVYAYLTATHTYQSGEERLIKGFCLQPNLRLDDGETPIERAKRTGDPDKVWTPRSRAYAKILFGLCYLGLNVLGSATLILTVLSAPQPKEAKIKYPANGAIVQLQERLNGTAKNLDFIEPPWIVLVPWNTQKFCPQAPTSVDALGRWWSLTTIGVEHESEEHFDLLLVGVDQKASEAFQAYLKTRRSAVFPGIDRLPEGVQILDEVSVRRQ